LKDYAENEPTYNMIIQLYHANNHIMLSLTAQLLPSLAEVLTSEEPQIKMTSRTALLDLVKALRVEFPQLFEGQFGALMAQL
jgi:importin-4